MSRIVRYVLLLTLFLMGPMTGLAWAIPAPPDVTESEGKVSVKATEVPLVDVLKAMEKKAGVVLKASPKLEGLISCDLVAATVEEALKKLLVDYNYALFQRQKVKVSTLRPQNYLLWIYEKKRGGEQAAVSGKVQPASAPSSPLPSGGVEMKTMSRADFRKDFDDSKVIIGQLEMQEQENISSSGGGVLVRKIKAGSSLTKIGIVEGDLISDINGTTIRSVDDFAKALTPEAIGDKRVVRLERWTPTDKPFVPTNINTPKDKILVPIYINITD